MRLHVHPTAQEATLAATERVAAVLASPASMVMAAGGNSPLALYAEIARRRLDQQRVRLFALDEYVGVPGDDPHTTAAFLRRTVVEPWGIRPERFHALDTRRGHAEEAIRRHERRIRRCGGLDLAILGLGRNGHLGFNEPGSLPDSPGRIVPLEPVTIESNRRWFGGAHAPELGVTTGLALLLASRAIVVLAFGEEKAEAVRAMASAPPTSSCPASFLQGNAAADVYLDAAAAALLPERPVNGAAAAS